MTSHREPGPAARRSHAAILLIAMAIGVAACGSGASAGAAVSTSAAASSSALQVLEQQAFIDAPQAYRVVPAFGSLWVDQVATYDNDAKATWVVTRIDPKTNTVAASIPISQTTDGMAATDTGLWVLDGDAKALREIDPASNKLTGRSITGDFEGGDLLSANGRLWHLGFGQMESIDPSTGAVTKLPPSTACGADACGAVVTPDSIYLLRDGTLTKLSLDGSKVLATNTTDVAGAALALGPDGLYVGSSTASVAIIDPATLKLKAVLQADPATSGDGSRWQLGSPGNGDIVAVDGGAWVRFSPQIVARVDAKAKVITLYGGPFPSEVMAGGASDIAVADGSLWVTNVGEGSGGADGGKPGVYRLKLPTP